jgi:4-hydroxybenzoyl-CoA thioesterase
MITLERPIRFQDVDAAGLVFFPNYLAYAHEAMEALFEPLAGGYTRLILERRIGLPAVRVEAEFVAPMRFGELLAIEVSVARLGNRSLTLRFQFRRPDGTRVAETRHTVVTTDLEALRSCPMPEDVRAICEQHLER